MRRLGYNESPTADPTGHGFGSTVSKLIVVAFAALLLFFLGTGTAFADGALGEVTDSLVDSGQTDDSSQTDDSDDSGPLNQVTEPVTEPVAPDGQESQKAPDDGDGQASPADSKTADTKQAEPTDSKLPESDGAAAPDSKSDSLAVEPNLSDEAQTAAQPADEAAEDENTTGSLVDGATTTVSDVKPADAAGEQLTGLTDTVAPVTEVAAAPDSESDSLAVEPNLSDEAQTTAQPADEAAEDGNTIGSLADGATPTVSDVKPADAAGEQLTGLADTVAHVTEAVTGFTRQAAEASDRTVDSVSDSSDDLVVGTVHVARLPTAVVEGIFAGGDVAGLFLPSDVVYSGVEVVGNLTQPIENILPVISSSGVEQAGEVLDVSIELITTSVDQVAQSSTATLDDLLATADDLVESTAGRLEDSLAGSPTEDVIEIIAPDLADKPKVTETSPSPLAPAPVIPELVDQPRPDASQPGVIGRSPSTRDVAQETRSILSSTTSVDEILAMEFVHRMPDTGAANRADRAANSSSPIAALSSTASPSFGLFLVLAAIGLLALRFSRWLRLEPVLWRRYALAAAIDRPG